MQIPIINQLMKLLILLTIFSLCFTKQAHIQLTLHYTKMLVLFGSQNIYLQWNFSQTSFILDEKLQFQHFYLDKEHKISLNNFDITYKHRSVQNNPGSDVVISGTVGLAKHNNFLSGLSKITNSTDVKLWFKLSTHQIQIIPLKCFNPIFPPYDVSVETWTKNKIEVNTLSMNFYPNSLWVALLNRTHNPFQMSLKQLRSSVTLTLENQNKHIKVEDITGKCAVIAGMPQNYQCQMEIHESPDYGYLVMQFQPVICNNGGIQLLPTSRTNLGNSNYYWLHFLVLISQFIILIMYFNQECIKKFLLNTKGTKRNSH